MDNKTVIYTYGRKDGYQKEFTVECNIVSVETFVFGLMREVNGLGYLHSSMLDAVINNVRVKQKITFEDTQKENVIKLFKDTFNSTH